MIDKRKIVHISKVAHSVVEGNDTWFSKFFFTNKDLKKINNLAYISIPLSQYLVEPLSAANLAVPHLLQGLRSGPPHPTPAISENPPSSDNTKYIYFSICIY